MDFFVKIGTFNIKKSKILEKQKRQNFRDRKQASDKNMSLDKI